MRAFFVGHRGSGKTSFLRLLTKAYPDVPSFDLDARVEAGEGQSVSEIFASRGESEFRKLELKYFEKILAEHPSPGPLFVAVGAGFDSRRLPKNETYWLGRRSDREGRVFFNRPRLSPIPLSHARHALEDYLERFEARDRAYGESAGKNLLWIEEGGASTSDLKLFSGNYSLEGASLTLTPNLKSWTSDERKKYFEKLCRQEVGFLELRTDLFTNEDILKILADIPHGHALLSVRSDSPLPQLGDLDCSLDWDESRALPTANEVRKRIKILSSHSARAPEGDFEILKWAPEVNSWEELKAGLRWQGEDPARRSFLARSPADLTEARFGWLRLLMKGRQRLNFFKERCYGKTDEARLKNADQPLLSEWIQWNKSFVYFAAVLGDPVLHSWSPNFHRPFFQKREMNFAAISIREGELASALAVLGELGMKAAAVTSPLKTALFDFASERDSSTFPFRSANTLLWTGPQRWKAWNTDIAGAEFLLRGLERHRCAIIGGGGTQEVFRSVLPHASFYSARTLELKSGIEQGSYDIVIWAAGGQVARLGESHLPPSCFSPRGFIDLDYRENSSGRAVASFLKTFPENKNLRYVPGLKMFFKQARSQQEIWAQAL